MSRINWNGYRFLVLCFVGALLVCCVRQEDAPLASTVVNLAESQLLETTPVDMPPPFLPVNRCLLTGPLSGRSDESAGLV